MRYETLDRRNYPEFIARLAATEPVFAPVSLGWKSYAFRRVTTAGEIALHSRPTILPPKKFFMPQRERIVEFDVREDRWDGVLEYEKMILFGVHTCDLAGIQCLNIAFSDKPKDINYLARKNRILIVGLECAERCDEFASCGAMDTYLPNGGYDLFMTEMDDSFLIHVNTAMGEDLLARTALCRPAEPADLERLEALRAKKRKVFKPEMKVPYAELAPLFEKSFDSTVWDALDRKCVACNNCTLVCPTCYCFDIRDEMDLDLSRGRRWRVWDGCQNETFARVAGGENFREKRGDRQRHRYYRKFKYPFDRYGRYFCTGCGRCSRTCMAKINLRETVDALAEGER